MIHQFTNLYGSITSFADESGSGYFLHPHPQQCGHLLMADFSVRTLMFFSMNFVIDIPTSDQMVMMKLVSLFPLIFFHQSHAHSSICIGSILFNDGATKSLLVMDVEGHPEYILCSIGPWIGCLCIIACSSLHPITGK